MEFCCLTLCACGCLIFVSRGWGEQVVVVDFFATWCGPCRAVAPHVESLSKKYGQVGLFAKVDVDQAQDVAQHCSIRAMPTFHVYVSGTRVEEIVGADVQKLEAAIERHAPKTLSFGGEGRRLGGSGSDAPLLRMEVRKTAAKPAPSVVKRKVETEVVDATLLKQLTEMGFGRDMAERALKATNSESMGSAVDFIASATELETPPATDGKEIMSKGTTKDVEIR